MSEADTSQQHSVAPIALGPGEGEALWFLGGLATVKASAETTGGRVAVIEHLAPRGSGSPLHVHHREDEWFYVLEGELTFWVGGEVIVAPAGSFVFGPRDIPHTFIVSSDRGPLPARDRAGRLRGLHARGRRPGAERLEIPPAPTEPPDVARLTRAGRELRDRDRRAARHPGLTLKNRRAGSAATGRPSSSSRNRLRSSPPA